MNTDLKEILQKHHARYPKMLLQDEIKLVYQHVLGAGHMIASPEASLSYLKTEMAQGPFSSAEGIENIGNGRVRLYLSEVLERSYLPEMINQIFVFCSNRPHPSLPLREALQVLEPSPELDAYIASGMPSVHHSEIYRTYYHPAYRVIDADCAQILPLLDTLYRAPKPLVLAIDGMCGSGKTTLASLLTELFSCSVIHMDDFFLPFEMRTPERLAQPGGNIHYERILAEVLPHLGTAFDYAAFQCSDGSHRICHIDPADILILEGSYSLHPALRKAADLSVFLRISPEEQLKRIAARDGVSALKAFQTRWIPMENRYFETYHIADHADFIFE